MIEHKSIKIDLFLVTLTFIIFCIGIACIYSATYQEPGYENFALKQLLWGAFSIVGSSLIFWIGYKKFIQWGYLLYLVSVVLLILVLFMPSVSGAHRWFRFFGLSFQPSELAKLTLILVVVKYLGGAKRQKLNIIDILVPILFTLVVSVLILVAPDLGTAVILWPLLICILVIAGIKPKTLVLIVILGLALLPLGWDYLRPYQRERLLVFLNPDLDPLGAGYTIIQSKIAIGAGGIFGSGWLSGTQNQLNFLPERHTDFVFSVAGEGFGFVGVLIILLLYYLFIIRGFGIALRTTEGDGKLLAAAITALFTIQIIINVGMSIGIMPVVGLPLPLISYGGSSLFFTIIGISLLLDISRKI